MLDPWVNDTVVFLFGLAFGGVTTVATVLDPRTPIEKIPRAEGERWLDYQRRILKQQDEELGEAGTTYSVTGFVFLALIAVLVVSLVFSPLDLGWRYLLLGVVVGYAVFRGIYELVRRGSVGVPDRLIAWVGRGRKPGRA